MEWALAANIFHEIQKKMGICSIDLFASAQNHILPVYCSYVPDNKALAIKSLFHHGGIQGMGVLLW